MIIGAGFAGLHMLHCLRGHGMSAQVFEAGGGVGGTWYWNRYPGARCDIESMQYSYAFSNDLQQEWTWTERYAAQPEILRYANHVADRLDLRRNISLNTRVTGAAFDEATGRWTVETEHGDRVSATFLIMAVGCLSAERVPDYRGLSGFKGGWYHTGAWPAEGVDFAGRRVAVVGTGSSGIQAIPIIAEQASHLFVFQRTANFSVPAHNGPLDPDYERAWKANYDERRAQARAMRNGILNPVNDRSALEATDAEREYVYKARWATGGLGFIVSFNDLVLNQAANDTAADFVRARIRDKVRDPKVAETLLPRDHPIGTKRICVDSGYYETFNRPNVTLVDLRASPIQEITPTGIRTHHAEYAVDSIVFATGFDAMTGPLTRLPIRGCGGRLLADKWADGPRTYLGLMTEGFANLFMVTGPGSPSVLSNMMVSIEQHVEWIGECLAFLRTHGLERIEPTREAEDSWAAHVDEVAQQTLFPRAASWYMGANIPGKPRVFMPYAGGVNVYRQICDESAAAGYRGFAMAAGTSVSVTAKDATR